MRNLYIVLLAIGILAVTLCAFQFTGSTSTPLKINKRSRIVLIGNNLGSRMMNFGHFETEMHLRNPDSLLFIRNMCDGGNTPGFRPHAGRVSPWAFPGAEKFQTELATYSDSQGHFETEDEWLTRLKADIIIAFFGYNESFQGEAGLENYKAELDAFIKYTLSKKYNGQSPPQLAIVSPIAFEDLSKQSDLPDGKKENVNLALYTKAMEEVATGNNVHFLNAYEPSKEWFTDSDAPLTTDGSQLNDAGYAKFSVLLADQIFGKTEAKAEAYRASVRAAILEKTGCGIMTLRSPTVCMYLAVGTTPLDRRTIPLKLQRSVK